MCLLGTTFHAQQPEICSEVELVGCLHFVGIVLAYAFFFVMVSPTHFYYDGTLILQMFLASEITVPDHTIFKKKNILTISCS
jgi:hypothetical protein